MVYRKWHLGLFLLPALASCVSALENIGEGQVGELVVEPGQTLQATVSGQAAVMGIDPDIGARRLLNHSFAEKIGLKKSAIQGAYWIGPVELIANSRSASFDLGASSGNVRFHWFDRDIAQTNDGLISPTLLPYRTVKFVLRSEDSEATKRSLILKGPGTYGFSGGEGSLRLGDDMVAIGFNPQREHTIVSAAVGAILASTHGGAFHGDVMETTIRYGVTRPVRLMELDRPLDVAGAIVRSVLVRTNEAGDAIGKTVENKDQDEIVVIGSNKRKPKLTMTLGAQALEKCSSFEFDNEANEIILICVNKLDL